MKEVGVRGPSPVREPRAAPGRLALAPSRLAATLPGLFGAALVAPLSSSACVPEGPPTSEQSSATASAAKAEPRAWPSAHEADPPLYDGFVDRFDREELGDAWRALSPAWSVRDGELCASGAHNRGVWLRRRLPDNARISFVARSESAEGDLKLELFGDGRSGAKGASYDHASGYVLIYGGWSNRRHVLARLDEHGKDRLMTPVDRSSEDPARAPVEPGRNYRFVVERRDGRQIAWWVDDALVHRMDDAEPLVGAGHDHLGFNDWAAPVCFDDVEVTAL